MSDTWQHLPFGNGQFTALFSNLCLQLVNDPDAMLREVFRGSLIACLSECQPTVLQC
jgi:hypothetical protein